MWPHHDAVAKRASQLFADYKQGLDIAKYATTGQEDRRLVASKGKRSDSPGKNTQTSTKGGNWKGSQESVHEVTATSNIGQGQPT